MTVARKLATFADLLDLPEDSRAEVVAGDVSILPAPLPEHGRAQRAIGRFIGGPFDDDHDHGGPGGWWILLEVDIELGDHDVVRPDVAGWRRERLRDPWGKRPIRTVPGWVCEILSPSNESHDRVTKADLYREHGVGYYWMVDPLERILEAYLLEDGRWVRIGAWDGRATVRVPPFDEVELEVGRLFPPTGEGP